MESVLLSRPNLSCEDAATLATARFGVNGTAVALTSERDQNFRVDAEAGSFVLKIANGLEQRENLEFQNALLARLSGVPVRGLSKR